MKLYLSSFHLGNKSSELVRFFSQNKEVAVIINALDVLSKKERSCKVQEELSDLSKLGLIPSEVDLRKYFGDKKKLYGVLKKYQGVWIRGGNVFVLRKAFYYSGFDEYIIEKSKNKQFVYAGFSAGICILSPTLKGYEIVDNHNVVPRGYKKKVIWKGLNIVSYAFAPHFKSNHPESVLVDAEIKYIKKHNIPYKTLSDGEVIIDST